MGVEVLAASNENLEKDPKSEMKHSVANVSSGPAKGLDIPVIDNGPPQDVKEDWSTVTTKYVSFYFPKYRRYEIPELRLKKEQAQKEVEKKRVALMQLQDKIRDKIREREEVLSQLKPLNEEDKAFRFQLGEKRVKMQPLQEALGKFKSANNALREKGQRLCSSQAELDQRIQELSFIIEHESISISEETRLVREIEKLKKTRPDVIAFEQMQAKLQESMGDRDSIQGQVKSLGSDMDAVRKEQKAALEKVKPLEEKLKLIKEQIAALRGEREALENEKKKAENNLRQRKQENDNANLPYVQNLNLLKQAKGINKASELRELSHQQIEKFMESWNNDKSFRDDYRKRASSGLSNRFLCQDGRMMNYDEQPTFSVGKQDTQVNTEKENLKKEGMLNSMPSKKQNPQATSKNENKILVEDVSNKPLQSIQKSSKPVEANSEDEVGNILNAKPATNLVASETYEKMKRDIELSFQKKAQRKKKEKLERAVQAQKEAEKKQKAKGKKGPKKPIETQPEANSETEMVNHSQTEESPAKEDLVNQKERDSEVKEKPKHKKKEFVKAKPPPYPKSALKRKKSIPDWVWVAVFAAVIAVVLMIFILKSSY